MNHPIIEFLFSQSEIIKPDFNIHVPEVVEYGKEMNLKGKYMSCDQVYKILEEFFTKKKSNNTIFELLCQTLNFSETELKGDSRLKNAVRRRHYVCYKLMSFGISTTEAGKILGFRDHSTMIHANRKVLDVLQNPLSNKPFYDKVQEWEDIMNGVMYPSYESKNA